MAGGKKPASVKPRKNGTAPSNPSGSNSLAPSSISANSSLFLLPLLLLISLLSLLTIRLHYRLPTPVTSLQSLQSEKAGQGALFSEENSMEIMHQLAEEIGYRIVGTSEHLDAEDWLEAKLRGYEGFKGRIEGLDNDHQMQVEVWKQVEDGAHRFDFMSSVVWKKYYGMSNLIVRISDGTDESKAHSLLLNAHLDSTLPSPGAADDGMGIAILLEILRILNTPPRPKLKHSLILLFNNGEESLQDGSHAFITKHETVPSIQAVINLEACGVSGPELLFQSTSEIMIRAYSKVPHPWATVLANDVFGTGILLSDTDFRQFVQYGGVGGLDMAVVGNSWLYHTRKDIPKNIEPGVTQHFGENVLAIVRELIISPDSQLSKVKSIESRYQGSISGGGIPIYFSLLGKYFILISRKGFKNLSVGISVFGQIILHTTVKAENHFQSLKASTLSMAGVLLSLVFAILGSNLIAFIMSGVLDKGMSWFTHEYLPILLYSPPAILSVLLVQSSISRFMKKENRPFLERSSFTAMMAIFNLGLVILNGFGIGSAYILLLSTFITLFSLVINDFALIGWDQIEDKKIAVNKRVHYLTYFIFMSVPAVVGTEGTTAFLDLFVPLTGRIGEISPVDHIIATIVSTLTFFCLPAIIPLSHRFGTQGLKRAIYSMALVTVLMVAVFASDRMKPFDEMHQKRLFVHQVENITSGEWIMNLGGADPAPKFKDLIDDLQREVGIESDEAELVEMNDDNPSFDILYPVSTMITPYRFSLARPLASEVSPWYSPTSRTSPIRIQATNEVIDLSAGTRRIKLEMRHPNLIWTVIAFNAEVLEWDLPSPPPSGFRRHHIKEVSRFGRDTWSVELLIRLDEKGLESAKRRGQDKQPFGNLIRMDENDDKSVRQVEQERGDESRLWIDFSGLDQNGMWPQKRITGRGQRNIETFEKMDGYLMREHPEVDAMLLGVVGGVAVC